MPREHTQERTNLASPSCYYYYFFFIFLYFFASCWPINTGMPKDMTAGKAKFARRFVSLLRDILCTCYCMYESTACLMSVVCVREGHAFLAMACIYMHSGCGYAHALV